MLSESIVAAEAKEIYFWAATIEVYSGIFEASLFLR